MFPLVIFENNMPVLSGSCIRAGSGTRHRPSPKNGENKQEV